MKKFLALTLILTLIFPVYCFGNPLDAVPLDDKLMKVIEDLIADEAIMEEFMTIMQDEIVELEEIENLKEFIEDKMIISADPTQECFTELVLLYFLTGFTILLYVQTGQPGSFVFLFLVLIALNQYLNCISR